MKRFLVAITLILASGMVFAAGNRTMVFSNSVLNQFQCNNEGWVYPHSNVILFDGPCTPLQGMARNTGKVYTIETSANKCPDDQIAVYTFAGWEGQFDFVKCKKD